MNIGSKTSLDFNILEVLNLKAQYLLPRLKTDKAKLREIGGRLPAEKWVGGPLFHRWSRRGKPRVLNFWDSRVAKVEK